MSTYDEARDALAAWRRDADTDPYSGDEALRGVIDTIADAGRRDALHERAATFGQAIREIVAPAVARCEQRGHGPELRTYDGIGRRIEAVEFDGAYHVAGAPIWASGLVSDSATPGRAYEQATMLYLLSSEGEAGHACPAVCTIGMARALRRRGEPAVRDRFLPKLVDPGYATAERASQFMTEVQGGSDVGANAAVAVAQGDGTYRIRGEKWFCSVADAQQFLMTARVDGGPDGTRGLGCFAVPRLVDGEPNGFHLRRLKDKLGTRAMASGEIDFDGALAYPIGPIEDGFKIAAGIVLNTSRWLTAVGATGMMRRAYVEASAYARHRTAFGQPIERFPLVQATLERMRAEWLASLHFVWMLTGLEDAIDAGTADEETVKLHRFCVNVAKYTASIAATRVVRDGIEVLGGNGTIEDFSVLPRLYRDAIVYESWEGTHNVLAQQVYNDCLRLGLLDVVEAHLPDTEESKGALADARHALDDPTWAAANFRAVIERIARSLQVGLLDAAGIEPSPLFGA